jgi:hypothetical protein
MIKRQLKFMGVSRQAESGSNGFATKPIFAKRPKLSQPCGFGSLTRGGKVRGMLCNPQPTVSPEAKPIGKPNGSTNTPLRRS